MCKRKQNNQKVPGKRRKGFPVLSKIIISKQANQTPRWWTTKEENKKTENRPDAFQSSFTNGLACKTTHTSSASNLNHESQSSYYFANFRVTTNKCRNRKMRLQVRNLILENIWKSKSLIIKSNTRVQKKSLWFKKCLQHVCNLYRTCEIAWLKWTTA